MTVLELSELVKELEAKFGVSAAAPVAMVAASAGGAAPAAAAEEKTEFDVILTSFGAEKIQVIKEIRAITSLGLKEAKDLVESAPKPIKEAIPKDEAAAIQKKFADVGAKVEIKYRRAAVSARLMQGPFANSPCSEPGLCPGCPRLFDPRFSHACTAFPRTSTASASTSRRSRRRFRSRT
jgi:large subunit ribosomal protein L7/L12